MGKNNRIPLVSVCCMTYNHDKFISQCLDGIIQQKGNFSIEILIHDDASSDHTRQIIEFYRDKYPDIIKNTGILWCLEFWKIWVRSMS